MTLKTDVYLLENYWALHSIHHVQISITFDYTVLSFANKYGCWNKLGVRKYLLFSTARCLALEGKRDGEGGVMICGCINRVLLSTSPASRV